MRAPRITRRRLVCTLVSAFWAACVLRLVWEEYGPAGATGRTDLGAMHGAAMSGDGHGTGRHMGIYVGQRRVGRLSQTWTARGDSLLMRFQAELDVVRLLAPDAPAEAGDRDEMVFPARIVCESRARKGRLEHVSLAMGGAGELPPLLTAQGEVVGDQMRLCVRQGDQVKHSVVAIDPQYGLDFLGSPLGRVTGLSLDKVWRVRLLNPLSMEMETCRARVTHRERIRAGDRWVPVYVVEVGRTILPTTLWVDDSGEVLRQKVMGFVFVKEPGAGVGASQRIAGS